uniref:Uncharacterized protein n=1 Tax=Timema bartmani TaxID=61472 RepID=A0A7R9F3T1_9NEOP|nr:unnamed protein product [Timema bartmani]
MAGCILTEECEVRERYKRCDRCTEAIPVEKYQEHTSAAECTCEYTHGGRTAAYRSGKLTRLCGEKCKSKVNEVGMRYFRNVCGKTRMDRVSDEWVLKELRFERESNSCGGDVEPLSVVPQYYSTLGGRLATTPHLPALPQPPT